MASRFCGLNVGERPTPNGCATGNSNTEQISIGRGRDGADDLTNPFRDIAKAVRLTAVEIITIAGLKDRGPARYRHFDSPTDDEAAFLS